IAVIETGKNLGYAGGNNAGMRAAIQNGADFVFLLNNDTIVDRDVVRHLVEAAGKNTEGAFFCPKIYFYAEPTKIWYAGGKWDPSRSRSAHVGYGVEETGQSYNAIREIDYACGCALLARATVIRQIGMLDERFFLTFEETDWCFRARAAGFGSFF